ncbi:MAG: methyltransferase [Bacteroidota bacterium]
MKIGTDAVLLGAWADCENASHILDVGTGTGILALMMAQRTTDVNIDAVELDSDAALLAGQNAKLSPWSNRIAVCNVSFQEFSQNTKYKYSHIICNPPFFSKSLKAAGEARNLARHNDTLPEKELLSGISTLLSDTGKAALIIPSDALKKWSALAEKSALFLTAVTWVKSSPLHEPHRVMIQFARSNQLIVIENQICIYQSKDKYSAEYQNITKDFYLKI